MIMCGFRMDGHKGRIKMSKRRMDDANDDDIVSKRQRISQAIAHAHTQRLVYRVSHNHRYGERIPESLYSQGLRRSCYIYRAASAASSAASAAKSAAETAAASTATLAEKASKVVVELTQST